MAVRLPPFWPERPAVWFAQAEAQFTLAYINSERIKFCHVISQLDHRYATEVEDIITSPPEQGPYNLLRTELVRRLSSSPEQRFRQLLTVKEIGDRKQSKFLRYLKSLAPDVSGNVIRSVWTRRLPRNVQSFLAGQTESNSEAAVLCGDRISEVEVQPGLAGVDEPTDIGTLRQEIAQLSRQVAALSTEQDRFYPRFSESDNKPRDRGSSPKRSRPAFNNHRPGSRSLSRGTLHPVSAGTTAASALGHKTVLRPAPTASREPDAADIIGGTCLTYDNRPPLHNRQSQETAVPSQHGFGPLCIPPQARPSTNGTYQL
ncbi:uncharacterized protein LOC111873161 [Cryptotermes secundus]|uniref:uncharacterized protein LOC111873161 n=1 Tax=Cryptotermes secundus TaxID=105785 RepID=UPI000CD7B330|nr:uncharacterized protein LOC111873161 [Cryptotermes secundus]